MSDMVQVLIALSPDEAFALGQLVKRLVWSDMRNRAVHDTEAELMRDAIERVRVGLAEQGYSPR